MHNLKIILCYMPYHIPAVIGYFWV